MSEETLRRKADQQWELAGLARQDNDLKASADHMEKAREYQRQLGELVRAKGWSVPKGGGK